MRVHGLQGVHRRRWRRHAHRSPSIPSSAPTTGSCRRPRVRPPRSTCWGRGPGISCRWPACWRSSSPSWPGRGPPSAPAPARLAPTGWTRRRERPATWRW